MEKLKTTIAINGKKETPVANKTKKSNVANMEISTGATAKVKSKVGHGLANEGTTGTYEEGDR